MRNIDKKRTVKLTRRRFMTGAAASGAMLAGGCQIVPRHVLGGKGFVAPSEKINLGIIGCGNQGFSNLRSVDRYEDVNIVALCDVDLRTGAQGFRRHPRAMRYRDYRVMFEEEDDLDAVVVAIPDHSHATASVMAMKRGLHVYCEKPLTHSIHEARVMREVAERYGVATQMGNGGMASDSTRRAIEIIRSGALGAVREVHLWSDRPMGFWDQAMDRPTEPMDIPETLDWDLWLGPAPERPYHRQYAPFSWRGWWDFGTGALGDMGCHRMAMPHYALELTDPTSVEATTSALFSESAPAWSIVKWEFPARGSWPPVTMYWYDGGKLPPADLFFGEEIGANGLLAIGDRGRIHDNTLLPRGDFVDYEPPEPTLPRSPGHHREWLDACKGNPIPPMSNFDIASRVTEAVLLGNVAVRLGHKVEWDARRMRVKNCGEAGPYLKRDYRRGYSL